MQVTVGDSSNGKGHSVCGKFERAAGKSVLEIACVKQLRGRYVRLYLSKGPLTLCEVKVMGTSKSISCFNSFYYRGFLYDGTCQSAYFFDGIRKNAYVLPDFVNRNTGENSLF